MKSLELKKTGPPSVILMLCAVLALCFLATCKQGTAGGGDRVEEVRLTSPDGRFDAVITRETVGGSLGGVYWNAFVVPKGDALPKDDQNSLLYAEVLKGEKLVWKQNHLLEIHYDIAHIEQFRNLWGSNELRGRGQGWRRGDYLVEVRLVPTSSDFSFLNSDGDFRPI
jgi:hypothetical protein